MFDLTNQVALVTGATGGIGHAIVKALHAQGAIIAASGTNADKLATLKAEFPERLEIFAANLGDSEALTSLVNQVETQFGKLDILVNNAGITRDTLAMRMTDAQWDEVLNLNLRANFILCRAAVKGMMKRRAGRIINITSIVGVTGNPGQTNYAAAKAGLIGMSKSLAAEVASRGITVNCIAPGFIATPMTEVLADAQKDKLNERIPMGRMGTPKDIATATVYLASVEAAYVTGQTLHVNGGMAMI